MTLKHANKTGSYVDGTASPAFVDLLGEALKRAAFVSLSEDVCR